MSPKEKILLHACCAPCSTYPIQILKEQFQITVFFYNPNIYPLSEQKHRREEMVSYGKLLGIPVISRPESSWEFDAAVAGLETLGERSDRCWECYRFRLEETAKECHRLGIKCFTTTLSISPFKDVKHLNSIGRQIAEASNLNYLEANFKKKNGFKISVEMSRTLGMYRQNYCGCRYSYEEMQERLKRRKKRLDKVNVS